MQEVWPKEMLQDYAQSSDEQTLYCGSTTFMGGPKEPGPKQAQPQTGLGANEPEPKRGWLGAKLVQGTNAR